MQYTVFSDHIIGQSHVAEGMGCEDYSAHRSDPNGRFAIGVICDGHSDPRCFRSAEGAKLGCAVVTEALENFFNDYYAMPENVRAEVLTQQKEQGFLRLRAAIVTEWNQRVRQSLLAVPPTEQEMKALDVPQYREALKLYRAGKAMNNIYGATMLAATVCEDFTLLLQIGDGTVICLEGDGHYLFPMPEDSRPDLMGPASLCDHDLISREDAFRTAFLTCQPQAVFVTSDGIGDLRRLQLRENLCSLQRGLIKSASEQEETVFAELNDAQSAFLHSFLEYFSSRNVRDDCSLAGFYRTDLPVADVRVEKEELDILRRELDNLCDQETKKYEANRARLKEALLRSQNEIQTLQAQADQLQKQMDAISETLSRAEKTNAGILDEERAQEQHFARVTDELNQKKQALSELEEASFPQMNSAENSDRPSLPEGADPLQSPKRAEIDPAQES